MKANQHALTVIFLFCLVATSRGTPGAFNLTLLHTADTLSTVTAADDYGNACQPVNDATFSYASFSSGVNCYGGAARMRTLIEREGARSDHVFLVDSGASLAFSLYFYLYGSPLIADYFGLLGYDAVAWQAADLQSHLHPGAFMLRARDNNSSMQFVCSNIQGFDAPAGTALSRYAIKTFANTGHAVGYISTLAANLASMIREPNVSATNEAQALREGLAALVNKGVNKVVATVSSNATAELVLTSVPGIDILIVPGQLQSNNNNGPGFLASRVGPYPMVYDTYWGQPVLVVSSGRFGRLVGVLNVEFDDHGVITAWTGDSVLMDDSVPADPALHAHLLTLDQSVQARFQQVVGWTAVNLSFDNQCIHGECGIGDWLSDSYRDFASGSLGFRVQIGFANGGAVRGGIPAGPVTLGQVHQTIPFGSNEVFAIRMLGLYVLYVLEHGLSLATNTTTQLMSGAGRFLFPSGLRFSWNPTEAPGLRVVDAYVEAQQGVWQLLLPNESYTLAIDRWLADGGDGFAMIPEYSTERYATGGNVNAMLFQALSRNVTSLQTGRITTTTAASRRTCLTAGGSICSGNGYCQTGECRCTVGGASGRLCTIRPAQASSSADGQATAIALGVALPLFVVVLVAVVVCALLVRAKKRESDSCWEIDTSELDMGTQLGAGGFGQVYQAVWKGTDVAVKVVPVGEVQQQVKAVSQTFKHEVRVMRELRHPNVVLFMAACTKPPRLCIVMELMELGSLYDLLHNELVPAIPLHFCQKAAFHAARGMHFLHSSGIVHRDLKSLNLLLDSKWNLKVSDFGLTRFCTDLKMAAGFKAHGTIHWAAPEVVKESPNIDYSLADVYSFGIVLWELLTRETPYGGLSLAAIAVGVLRDDLRPAPLDEIPTAQRFEPLEAIMVECWDRDPAMRPSFHEVMTRIAVISPKTDDAPVPLQRPSSSSSSSSEPSLSSSGSWGIDSLAAPATDVDVTVAFSDVANAAGPWESNPRDMRGAMEHHNQLLRKLLASHHGYESRFMQQHHLDDGEGYFCMVFADPTNALQWCEAALDQLHSVVWPRPAGGHATACVRFGVHKGSATRHRDPVSGRQGYDGAAVDVAMELTQHAEGGQVLVSDSVVAAIVAQHPEADFELRFRTVGVVPVKLHDTLNSADRVQAVGAFDMRPHAECPTYEHERERVERYPPPDRRLERIAIGSGNACKYLVNYEDLTLGDQPVGEGGYGRVYRGRWHGVEVAVKRLARKRFDEESRLQFREEASQLARLHHPHVVMFIGVCLRSPNVCIVTEWMPQGSLRDVLDDQTHELDWPLRLSLARGVALGLAYLHSFTPAILHLDLNSSNVLIDNWWNAKIADFALAQMKQENATTMPWCVTPAWTAPEIVRRERHTERADVFSLGVIMWELATRELPFAGDEHARVALHIVEGKRPAIPANLPPGYADLMQACWHGEALQRPSAEEVAHMLAPLLLV